MICSSDHYREKRSTASDSDRCSVLIAMESDLPGPESIHKQGLRISKSKEAIPAANFTGWDRVKNVQGGDTSLCKGPFGEGLEAQQKMSCVL